MKIKNKKAFSLVEVLIVSLISTIVMAGIAIFFSVFTGQINFLIRTSQLEEVSHRSLNMVMGDVMRGHGAAVEGDIKRELVIFDESDTEAIRYKSELTDGKYILMKKKATDADWKNVDTFNDKIQIDCKFISEKKNHVSIQLIVKYASDNKTMETRSVTRDVYSRNSTS